MHNKNPIYLEYYSHEGCLCYNIDNPWTKYRQETFVLCREDEGIEKAKEIAFKKLNELLLDSLKQPIKDPSDET